ncbi:MAG: hypothetical protein ABJ387_03495 [Balneola sp.]
MQSNVDLILIAANAVEGITKATAREFRESDEYPLFYCGSRRLPSGNNESGNTKTNRYKQKFEYICHVYVEANDSDTDYSDYNLAESLGDLFLEELLPEGKWELESIEQYPAKLGRDGVIVNEIILTSFRVKQYG